MFIVFIGPPGAGKGTQCLRLVEHLGIPHLSTGNLLRQACADATEVGRQAQQYMDKGQLVPDSVIMGVVEHRLAQPDCDRGCLFDGFPRTLPQAAALVRVLEARQSPLDVVLELKVDVGVLVQRLAGRGRADDKPAVVRKRLKEFYDQVQGLLDYYERQGLLQTIDGLGTPDEVFARIKAALHKSQPG